MMKDKSRKSFQQIIEEDFQALEKYLLADEDQVNEVWENQMASSKLYKTFTLKVAWKIEGFSRRYDKDRTSAEKKALASSYVNKIFESLRERYQEKKASKIDVNEISKELHLNVRRVSEYLRKLFDIPFPPKPLVRLYHLRKYTLKVIRSNPSAKKASDDNLSSFLRRLRDHQNPAATFLFNKFDNELQQNLSGITEENPADGINDKILRQICSELNRLIKEYDGTHNEQKQFFHQPPFMFFNDFSEFVREEEKVKYIYPLTNRYKNREILSRVFPEISPLESVRFTDLDESIATETNQPRNSNSETNKELAETIEKLFNIFLDLPRVKPLVKDFWARVERCVCEFCEEFPQIHLFKFLEQEGKWTDKKVKKCILSFCDNKEARFRRYRLNLRKDWRRVIEGKGKELYREVCETI